jgi:hypothetical protein
MAMPSLGAAETNVKYGAIPTSRERLSSIPVVRPPLGGEKLPEAIDLSGNFPPPTYNGQGNQNSCVAWAIAYALKSYDLHQMTKVPYQTSTGQISSRAVFSPAFIYNQINNGRDGGSNIIDALNVLTNQGAALWSDMPYSDRDYSTAPSAVAVRRASQYRIIDWRQINVQDTSEVKAHLNAGFPIVVAFRVDSALRNLPRGRMWSTFADPQLGYHAVTLVGYNNRVGAFKFMNSWGSTWSDGGFGWVSYALFQNVVMEGYIVRDRPPSLIADDTAPATAPPTPAPIRHVEVTRVDYAYKGPDGNSIRVEGNVDVPASAFGKFQTVLAFYDEFGKRLTSSDPRYTLPPNQLATASNLLALTASSGEHHVRWWMTVPYSAFGSAGSSKNVQMQTFFYLDKFNVGHGPVLKFELSTAGTTPSVTKPAVTLPDRGLEPVPKSFVVPYIKLPGIYFGITKCEQTGSDAIISYEIYNDYLTPVFYDAGLSESVSAQPDWVQGRWYTKHGYSTPFRHIALGYTCGSGTHYLSLRTVRFGSDTAPAAL